MSGRVAPSCRSLRAGSVARRLMIESLEDRQMLSVAPEITLIGPVNATGDALTIGGGAPVHYGVDGWFTDGSTAAIDYDVVVKNSDGSINTDITARILSGNRSIRITVGDVTGDGVDDVMMLELFDDRVPEATAELVELIQAGFYNSTDHAYDMTFHRVIENFMIQAGDPTGTGSGGSGTDEYGQFDGSRGPSYDDWFHPELLHIGPGVLSTAKSSDDTSDSQFFITDADTRWLDFNHSILGQLNDGYDVLAAISAVSVDGDDKPTTPVVIQSIEVIADDVQNATLFLSAPEGMNVPTGLSVIVTATNMADPSNAIVATMPLQVTPDTYDEPAFVDMHGLGFTEDDPNAIRVEQGGSVTFQIPMYNNDGGPLTYGAWDGQSWEAGYGGDFDISYDSTVGEVTLTPKPGVVGNTGILIGTTTIPATTIDPDQSTHPYNWAGEIGWDIYYWTVDQLYARYRSWGYDDATASYYAEQNAYDQWYSTYIATWDLQYVPVFVTPETPGSVTLLGSSDSGQSDSDLVTRLNNTAESLQFEVQDVTPGCRVTVHVDGVARGWQDVGTGETSVVVQTDLAAAILDGDHEITVTQSVNNEGAVTTVGNRQIDAPVHGDPTAPLIVTIDTTGPSIIPPGRAIDAMEGEPFSHIVALADSGDLWYFELLDDASHHAPAGMAIDPATGEITWTPGRTDRGIADVTVVAYDLAGNGSTSTLTIDVQGIPDYLAVIPVLQPTDLSGSATGESPTLPSAATGLDEWTPHWIEIWAQCVEPTDGLATLAVDLHFDDFLFLPNVDLAEGGPAFSGCPCACVVTMPQPGTIHVQATAQVSGVGDGEFVLVGRIPMSASPTGPGIAATVECAATSLTIGDSTSVAESGIPGYVAQIGPTSVAVASVRYDLSDDCQVAVADLALFASFYGRDVDVASDPLLRAADFNGDGTISVADLALFASNYGKSPGDALMYPESQAAAMVAPVEIAQTPTPVMEKLVQEPIEAPATEAALMAAAVDQFFRKTEEAPEESSVTGLSASDLHEQGRVVPQPTTLAEEVIVAEAAVWETEFVL